MATTSVADLITKLALYGSSQIPQALADDLLAAAKATRPQVTLTDFESCFAGMNLDTLDQLDVKCVHQSAFEVEVRAFLGGELVTGDIWYACAGLAARLLSFLALCTYDTPLTRSDLLGCFSAELLQHLTTKGIRLTSDNVCLASDGPVVVAVVVDE